MRGDLSEDPRVTRGALADPLEQASTTGAVTILRRFLEYGEKVYRLSALLLGIRDDRPRPRIPTLTIVRSVLVMFVARVGSLHALEQTQPNAFWLRWLGRALPSADSLGRIMDGVDPASVRQAQKGLYTQLKRNKALPATSHGLMALVIDGHESHATYRRRCSGCLQRRIRTRQGWRTQYYHRHVTAMLLSADFPLLLDAEMQRPDETEIAAARRLLQRLLQTYPRAFDVVVGDALYTDLEIYALLEQHGKDVLTVLKRNQPDLLREAQTLLEEVTPEVEETATTWKEVRDLGGFTAWEKLTCPLRVVRSRESRQVRRQLDGHPEELLSEWLWVTTCTTQRAPTAAIVRLGHARWDIENLGFNETVNRWHADHVYKHAANAMLTFWLMAMLAFNLFYAFSVRNLKPQRWRRYSYQHIARCLASELYTQEPHREALPP